MLLCRDCGAGEKPEDMAVHEIVRFQGETNPGDETILLALQGKCGHRGQYSTAFGPDTPREDAAALGRLSRLKKSDVRGSAPEQ